MENYYTLVSTFLPRLRANKVTYYNLDKQTKEYFKKAYKYLRIRKDKYITDFNAGIVHSILIEHNTDYITKIRAIEFISKNLVD